MLTYIKICVIISLVRGGILIMEKRIIMAEDEYEELNSDSNRLEYVMSLFKLEGNTVTIDKIPILSMILSKKMDEDGYKEITPVYGSGKLILLQGTNSEGQMKEVELSDYDIKMQ